MVTNTLLSQLSIVLGSIKVFHLLDLNCFSQFVSEFMMQLDLTASIILLNEGAS